MNHGSFGVGPKHGGDAKRVSISVGNNAKAMESNPKTFRKYRKSEQRPLGRHPKWQRMTPSPFSSKTGNTGGIIFGKTVLHEFNKPCVHAFLK